MSEKSENKVIAKLGELSKCPICFEKMVGGDYRPIAFVCGHTVCKTCALKITKQAGTRYKVECPECRAVSYNKDDFQPVYRLEAICEVVATHVPPIEKAPVVCTNCVREVGQHIYCDCCWMLEKKNKPKEVYVDPKAVPPSRRKVETLDEIPGTSREQKKRSSPKIAPSETTVRDDEAVFYKRITCPKSKGSAETKTVELVDLDP